jgi:hypothetical protein
MPKTQLPSPILAEGEVTGHSHRIAAAAAVFERDDGLLEFDLAEPADVTHEEHGTVSLPPGEYLSGRVREYDHAAKEARQVRD